MLDLFPIVRPVLHALPAETAHGLTIKALAAGLGPSAPPDDPALAVSVWGLDFPNPVGMSAGFDKEAEVPDAVLRMGFGFTECGTVTPLPQPGNERPRVFRLAEDRAVINRLGFNSRGVEGFAARLAARQRTGIVSANLGRNKETADDVGDFVACVEATANHADMLVINVSSPNTPGLRTMQRRETMERLLSAVVEARDKTVAGGKRPPLLVKMAPDLDTSERTDMAEVVVGSGVDGMIVCNTSIARPPELRSRHAQEAGGLSGAPVKEMSMQCLIEMRQLTGGKIPLIACGGIASADDAYARIRAGASLVQFYSAMIYEGPGLVQRIKSGLLDRLKADGFSSISDAIGADLR